MKVDDTTEEHGVSHGDSKISAAKNHKWSDDVSSEINQSY
jgi:hypothetical protein